MTVLSELRESRLFKAIADISVVHWFFTVVPGLITGVEAAMHGKPLEIVIAYFVGVSALMLVVLHYGALAWAKYFSTIKPEGRDQPAGKLWRIIIPAVALAVMLGLGYVAKPKSTSTIPSAPSAKDESLPASSSARQDITDQQKSTSTQVSDTLQKGESSASAATPKQRKAPLKRKTPVPTPEPLLHPEVALRQPAGASTPDQSYADTLTKFMEEGTAINQHFISTNNTGLLAQEEQTWSAKVQNDLEIHLGHSYAVQFKLTQGSAFIGCPVDHQANGCGYWQEIRAKNDALSRFITEARTTPPQTIIGVPGGVTTGNISQGTGSALSFNQTGGVTAGTLNVNPPPNPPEVHWTQEDVTADNNLRNPKLYPSWVQGSPSESAQKKIAERQQYSTNPGVIITGHINESWPTANFAADCDRPCQSLTARLIDASGWSEGYADGPGNVEVLFFVQPASLPPGVHFKWEIHSKDSQPIKVKEVRLVNLHYSGAN